MLLEKETVSHEKERLVVRMREELAVSQREREQLIEEVRCDVMHWTGRFICVGLADAAVFLCFWVP